MSKRAIRVRNRVIRFLQREAYLGSSSYTDKTVTDLAKKVGLELDENNQANPYTTTNSHDEVPRAQTDQASPVSEDLLTLEQRIKKKVREVIEKTKSEKKPVAPEGAGDAGLGALLGK